MKQCALVLLLALQGCSLSREEFAKAVHEARECEPGDACIIVELPQPCLCEVLINAEDEERIRELAGQVDCSGYDDIAICAVPRSNLRCEDGLCIGDF